ncbi:2-C-methyl-D-erythritol 4-phosphate cytidylyltransferase [Peptococcaceae bacterium]|nr:2-C-methyl-D-erythritol 4-phosphate cytidylyltransferase [Peptococcaceae bacterium]
MYVIIPAAGAGNRMKAKTKKQYLKLCGSYVICHTLSVFLENDLIGNIALVVPEEDIDICRQVLKDMDCSNVLFVSGGVTRQESVYKGLVALESLADEEDIVVVHDGARPLLTQEVLIKTIDAAKAYGSAICAVKVKDTVKLIDERNIVAKTLPRDKLVAVQTPQAFKYGILKRACKHAMRVGFLGTDDASLVENIGYDVHVVEGDYENIKLTTPEDMILAEEILKRREKIKACKALSEGREINLQSEKNCNFRIGIGYDVHRLVENSLLILGGVEIPHRLGLEGHSDADVLVHAVMDALLGAAGLGDIGMHFPDTDDKYKGAYSIDLLKKVGEIVFDSGYSVINIDAVIIAQKPRIAPYISQMRSNISRALKISENVVNIKATTTEKLGFVGREEGIVAKSAAMLMRCEKLEVRKMKRLRG